MSCKAGRCCCSREAPPPSLTLSPPFSPPLSRPGLSLPFSSHLFLPSDRRTFAELKKYSDALANGLVEIGVAPSETVLSWLPRTTAEYHVLQLACARAGFVLAPLPSSVTDPSVLSKVLKDSGAVALFVQGDTRIPFETRDESGNVVDDGADIKKIEYDDVYVNAVTSLIPSLQAFDYFRDTVDANSNVVPDEEFGKTTSHNWVDNGLQFSCEEFPR